MSVKVERASVIDAEEVLLLQKLAYRSEAELYNNFSIEPLIQTLGQLQAQFENHIILKATVDEIIIGSVRANHQDGTCYIGKLIVHPDHQNKGTGKLLMNAIEGLFPKSRYELFTGSKSEKNIALYEKLGYKAFKEHLIASDFSLVYLEKKSS
ncbi:GNAT family N-acetyltransferase [Paenibacillus sp. MY03]|uniref:GNAT family N-acetyltransferase n=1 Tax=Paenibacillus sp. MY03 TaxID=302980 RepID=UPI000B3CC820|nr:GNAT family N-acetyltransferase [Paenibacillus sp. MY03]OUS77036.1 GNAT family N-acetyltransferase [Paenibacillus sp. MY03]